MAPAQLATAADTALKAARTAVGMVTNMSDGTTVPAAERAALSRRLGSLEGALATAKTLRMAAMKVKNVALGKAMSAAPKGPRNPDDGSAQDNLNALNNVADNLTLTGQLDVDGEDGGGGRCR